MTIMPRRTARREPGARRLMPRDLLALRFIAEAQPVTARQVRALTGMSEDVAVRRLATLRDLKLVTVEVTAPHEPNRYLLAPAALPHLERAFALDRENLRTPRGVGRANLAHHDGVVDLYVALTVACARSGRARLSRFRFERELREAAGATEGVLVPDAVAVLDDGRAEACALIVEVDLGTENPSWFATRKAAAYGELWRARHPVSTTTRWAVAVVVPTERRLHRLALAAWEAGIPEGLMYFAVARDVTGDTVLTDVWATPRVVGDSATLVSTTLPVGVGTGRRNGSDGQAAKVSAMAGNSRSADEHAFLSRGAS